MHDAPERGERRNYLLSKWIRQTLGVLLIILIVILILNQLNDLKGVPQTMRVAAVGKITRIPDLATITIGVVTQDINAVEVKNKNNQKINQVIAYVKQQGIDTKNIKTSRLNVSPRYNFTNGQNVIVGYQADQTITVKVNDFDKSQATLEKILDGVVNNGANEIQGVNFSFANPDQLKQLARKNAIENAKEKAKELANEADLRLGKIINVLETDDNGPNPIGYATANFMVKSKSTAPNIEPGDQEILENIVLIYEVH